MATKLTTKTMRKLLTPVTTTVVIQALDYAKRKTHTSHKTRLPMAVRTEVVIETRKLTDDIFCTDRPRTNAERLLDYLHRRARYEQNTGETV